MNQTKNHKILIDSCILIYCGSDKYSERVRGFLHLLDNNKNKLAISEICGFEVLKNCLNKENIDYYLKLINYLDNIKIGRYALMNAAFLHGLYKKDTSNSDREEGAKKEKMAGDLIIGGTAIYDGALLLTANIDDFPMPYWKIFAHDHIVYKDGPKFKVLNVYLLEFDKELAEQKNPNQLYYKPAASEES